jgi:hypothetical protein
MLSRVNNDYGDTLLRLHLLALRPEADALHARLESVLDACQPTHAATVDALGSLLIETLMGAPPKVKLYLIECVRKALTDAVSE